MDREHHDPSRSRPGDEPLIWNQRRTHLLRPDLGPEGCFRQMEREHRIFLEGIEYIIARCEEYAATPEARDRLTDRFADRFLSTHLNRHGEPVTAPMVTGSVHQRLVVIRADRDRELVLRGEIDELLAHLDAGEPVDLADWERTHQSYRRIGETSELMGINYGAAPWVTSGVDGNLLCNPVQRAARFFAESVGWEY
jgi:hypothetical protein